MIKKAGIITCLIFIILVNIGICYAESRKDAESYISNLDQAPENYMYMHYLPSFELVQEDVYTCIGDNPVLFENYTLAISDEIVQWNGSVYFYSKEDQKLMFAIVWMSGDAISVMGGTDVVDTSEASFEELGTYQRIAAATREWEYKYGPVFDWSPEIKYQFYQQYQTAPLDMENNITRGIKYGLPKEENDLKSVLIQAHALIRQEYHFEVEEQKHFHEEAEFLVSSMHTGGQWRIKYWIQVQKGNKVLWTPILCYQQNWEGELLKMDGPYPEFMHIFIK